MVSSADLYCRHIVIKMATVVTLLLCLLLQLTHSIDIYPDCKLSCQTKLNQTNGATLNSALALLESNTTLVLQEPGCYCLDSFFLFTDIYNISIIGSGNTDDYIISCNKDVSLVFIRTEIFKVQNITINGCGVSGDHISHITYKISQSIVMFYHIPSSCGSFNRISASYEESITANEIGYTVGSSGGMGISLAQLNYSVNVMITSSQFSNNTGWVSAGIYVGIFEGARSSSINISNCEFSNNGFKGYDYRPFGVESATSGLLLFNNLHFPNETIYKLCTLGKLSDLNVMDSVFTGNQAYAFE